jgi:hypothetical protein
MADRIQLIIDGDDYWLEGADFEEMLETVRSLPGRKYDPSAKAWNLPGTPEQAASQLSPLHLMYADDELGGDGAALRVPPI